MPVKPGRGYRTIHVQTPNESIAVYTSARIARAFEELAPSMNLYQGVRLGQLLEAAYRQGKKDGARAAFGEVAEHFDEAKKAIPHLPPGRPRKKK